MIAIMRVVRNALLAMLSLALGVAVLPAAALASFSPPAVESESVSGVSEHDVTLEAQIETGGLYTGYQFEIDTNASYNFTRFACPFSFPGYAQCMVIVDGEPLPAGLVEPKPQYIPAGSGEQSVSLDLASIGATLAPGTTYHYRAAVSNGAQGAQGPDRTFTTPSTGITGTAPSIGGISVSNVTEHDATLEAQINPNGLATTYEFGLGKGCYPAACDVIADIPLPVEDLSSIQGEQAVSLALSSAGVTLQPNSVYYYWITATNAAGESHREGGIFKTPQSPVIESESASSITEHDATLEAQIDTSGRYTGYWFQIDTNASYDFTQPDCPFEFPGDAECESIRVGEPLPAGLVEPEPQYIPAGSGDQSVSLDLASIGATLAPGTTYHYRVIASDGGSPTVQGPDQTFTTLPSAGGRGGVEPLHGATPPATGSGDQAGTPGIASSGSAGSATSPGLTATSFAAPLGKAFEPKPLTRAQKRSKAFQACKKRARSRRSELAACERLARQVRHERKKKS
jgi:hypothetical protein